jgi:1,4-dihydroxy-6-naphthoate synthase
MPKTALPATRVVRVGHTPDMDDAYMFYGIAQKAIPLYGLQFEHIIEDIQALNQRSGSDDLDMTAVSAAGYPALAHKYVIAAVGSSVGNGYGPLIIAKRPVALAELQGKRIAVPGLQTTACMLLQLAAPPIELVPMNFTAIPQAVQNGTVAAGVVIHEWQLTYADTALVALLDLGQWWRQRHGLPIPLGLNVVNRRLPTDVQVHLTTVLRDSIAYALNHPEQALDYAMRYARGTDRQRSARFVGMYVNQDTLGFSQDCRRALRLLYEEATALGLLESMPPLDIVEPLP